MKRMANLTRDDIREVIETIKGKLIVGIESVLSKVKEELL